ncbi:unnamed protein product [Cylicocyclus nassatus]|uniref:Uncharacterized protein n=1 Tax=Cylicocyclus nassatus TaxID=53992 RepID=A0AA36H979_CYLNA|nr:unnamed protein product [Cylicocyclus nassatus]
MVFSLMQNPEAAIPFLLAYLPRFVMFFAVIMGYPPPRIYSFVPLVITLYTVLDPIAIIIFIKDYRRAVGKLIRKPYELLKTLQVRPVPAIRLSDCNESSSPLNVDGVLIA